MEYGTYNPDAKVILFRKVFNDAVVGPWQELEGVRRHTLDGLKEWMERENNDDSAPIRDEGNAKWDWDKLNKGGLELFEEDGLYDYGMRLQFWIPRRDKTGPQCGDVVKVRCVDTLGLEWMTEGKEYSGVVADDGLFLVKDDTGNEREFFPERFNRINQMFMRIS